MNELEHLKRVKRRIPRKYKLEVGSIGKGEKCEILIALLNHVLSINPGLVNKVRHILKNFNFLNERLKAISNIENEKTRHYMFALYHKEVKNVLLPSLEKYCQTNFNFPYRNIKIGEVNIENYNVGTRMLHLIRSIFIGKIKEIRKINNAHS